MERGTRKELTGIVVSDKMEKTRVVSIETWKVEPEYWQRVHSTRKVKAHEMRETSPRLEIPSRIVESRPLSADKRWRISEVVGKSVAAPGGDRA